MKLAVDGMQHESCVSFFICGFQGSQISCSCWWLDLKFISKSTGNYNFFVHRCLRTQVLRPDLLCYQSMTEGSISSLVEVRHNLPQAVWLAVLLYSAAFWSHAWLFHPCTWHLSNTSSILWCCFQHCIYVKCRPDPRRSQKHQTFQVLLPVLVHRWYGTTTWDEVELSQDIICLLLIH